ncbi:MAG: hypothetical protein IPL22_00315 [Bacteroidetes bacterium]|nr:hypothetical protein [Bacteroidota bacterium]
MKKNYMILMIGILGSLLLSTTGYSQSNSRLLLWQRGVKTNLKKPTLIELDKDGKDNFGFLVNLMMEMISDLHDEIQWNKN